MAHTDRADPPVPRAKGAKPMAWALGLRTATGILFVPLLVLLARAGGLAFLFFVALQTTLGLIEFHGMMRAKGLRPNRALGHVAALAVLFLAYRPHTPQLQFFATALVLLLLALALRAPERTRIVEGMGVTVFGVLYVGWLSAHFILLRELPWSAGLDYADGARFVLFAFLVTWSCDTGAYLFGRFFGRTRPFAHISPRKSIEGSVGGLACALVGAVVGRVWFMHAAGGESWLSATDALVLGLLVGVFGQTGDLVESLLKRDAASGDSSDLIPGHGGVLDRFDSLYFGAPVVYYYLKIFVFQIP